MPVDQSWTESWSPKGTSSSNFKLELGWGFYVDFFFLRRFFAATARLRRGEPRRSLPFSFTCWLEEDLAGNPSEEFLARKLRNSYHLSFPPPNPLAIVHAPAEDEYMSSRSKRTKKARYWKCEMRIDLLEQTI